MATITISKSLIKEKDLVVIPRRKYEELLKKSSKDGDREDIWRDSSKKQLLKAYSRRDSIYDKV